MYQVIRRPLRHRIVVPVVIVRSVLAVSSEGAHLHQSGNSLPRSAALNTDWAVPPGDPPANCGGDGRPTFLCLYPLSDYSAHWMYKIYR